MLKDIVKIFYNSDFTINAKLPEGYDNQDFIVRLYTTDNTQYFEASYLNGEFSNCLIDSNNNIVIYVNNRGLQPGCLHIFQQFDYDNTHFQDNVENIMTGEETNIYLVKQNANATSAMYVGSALPDLTDSSDFITESDLEFELLNYYTKEEIDNAGYISHTDLNDYVTEEELNDMGFLSQSQLEAMGYATVSYVDSKTDTKQDMLISGVNIKTVNGYSLLGNGNLVIEGGGGAIDLSAYVTKTELSQAGYVSQSQLSQAGYLTAVPDNYATKTYVENYVSEYAPQVDLSAYVTHSELNSASYVSNTELSQASYVSQSQLSQAGYLTTVPDNYATKTYVADYVDTHTGGIDLSAYVTKTELSQASYATQSYVDDAIADAFEDSDFVTETDVNNLLSTASYVTSSELSAMGYITNQDLEQTLSNATYITQNELESQLADYVTSSELSNAGYVTSSALSQASYVTSSDLSNMGYITSIPSEYVTESELSAKGYVTNTSLSNMGYITSIPAEYVTQSELSGIGYVTESQLQQAGYLTAVPAEYVTESEIAGMGYVTATDLSNASYATSTDLVSYLNIANFNRTVPVQLRTVGLTTITTNVPNTIAPQALTYSQFTALTNPWVGGVTMVNYVNEVMPKIDESIIPNTTNTYTLGDSSHLYSAAYITNVKFTDNGRSSISAPNSSSLRLAPDDIGFYLEKNGFRPGTSGNKLLGTSSMQWGYTYSQNFIENGTNIKDIYTQTEVVTQDQYDALTTEQKNSETIYVISDQQAYFDNELVTEQSLAAKGFLTADNFQYDPTTGTLTLVL